MNDKDKTDKEKIDYISQCFADGDNDCANGDCIDGKAFMDSINADIEREEDEEDRLLIIERENSPTIKLNLDDL
ncbi:hypothetical protein ACP45F_17390 [Vibrio metoecus]|uniref:Uncharacterized protein n=1 Tax=Vibrio metoecus TaxID=1481663 RepID=A0A0Q0KM46_VIBMT|nr:hypothetical protein [Vibrio metoecus]KQA24483.1 hypothetical protein AAY55_02815 [Vibrio metoecus]